MLQTVLMFVRFLKVRNYCSEEPKHVANRCEYIKLLRLLGRVFTVNNTTKSFLIDVIIRNQDIKKLRNNMFRPITGHHQVSS